ncbi:hypothetical protein ACFV1L_22105 [Kitasatospora sp. NPDC059646]|uniref:hypothetical protein n=1 Tax=Kitasatospora sp. NPDC059646 TaxID=3346893 RepID=UPI00367AE406
MATTASADLRAAFVAEVKRFVRKNREAYNTRLTTKAGIVVAFNGLTGNRLSHVTVTAPDGIEFTSGEGWALDQIPDAAAFWWDAIEEDRERAAKRKLLAGFKAVTIDAADADGTSSRTTAGRYRLTEQQLDELLALAANMALQNGSAG